MEEIQKLNAAVEDINKGLVALSEANAQRQKDADALLEQKAKRIAEDTAKAVEALQERQSALEVALQRPQAANDNNPLTDEQKAQKAAFQKLLRVGERGLTADEQKALSTDSDPDGGYLVPTQQLGIIQTRLFETSPMRRVATVIRTTAKSVEVVVDDQEAEARWIGEGPAGGETGTPKVGLLKIETHKLEAEPKQTHEMIQDSAYDTEAWLNGKVVDVFGRKENTAFVTGDGVGKPRGFLTYPAGTSSYERGKIEQVINGATTASVDGLIKLQGSLKEGYQARAVFAMKRDTLVQHMLLKGTDMYRFLNLQPATGPQGEALSPTFNMLGKPVILMDDMPVIGSNNLGVAYGDFGAGYTIVDRLGISVLVDPYTSKGFVKYYTTKRTGGAVVNPEAIKLLKYANS